MNDSPYIGGMTAGTPLPSFHDGFLDGIRLIESGKSVYLYLRTLTGERFELRLAGLERLNITDFREGNIILDCTVSSAQSASISSITEVHGLNGEESGVAERLLNTARKAGLYLLEISSSFGAQGTALFRDYSLVPEE